MFIVAPIVSLISAISGFVFANYWDFPPGQMSVAILKLLLAIAWLIKRTGMLSSRQILSELRQT